MYERSKMLDAEFFSERPTEDALPIGLPVVRAPRKGSDVWVLLNDSVLGCWTHFFKGRTQPCMGSECTICPLELARRWHGWVAGYNSSSRSRVLIELTAGPAVALAEWRKERGSLRGCAVKLSRRNNKENGQVVIQIAASKTDVSTLPPEVDLPALLMRIWQIRGSEKILPQADDIRLHNGIDQDYDEGRFGA